MPTNLFEELNHDEDAYVNAAIRDLFALGCYLYATGEVEGGSKACTVALRAAKRSLCAELVVQVDKELADGLARELALEACPHAQIMDVLRNKWPDFGYAANS